MHPSASPNYVVQLSIYSFILFFSENDTQTNDLLNLSSNTTCMSHNMVEEVYRIIIKNVW